MDQLISQTKTLGLFISFKPNTLSLSISLSVGNTILYSRRNYVYIYKILTSKFSFLYLIITLNNDILF